MTVEECFHRLMQMRETTVCQLEDEDYADVLTHDTDVDVFNMAIEALEKQIPKKYKKDRYHFRCQMCNFEILSWFNYCPKCGQRFNRYDNE